VAIIGRQTRRQMLGGTAATVGATGAALAACVPGQSGSGSTAGQPKGPVTLRFTNVWDKAREPLMQEQIADFGKLYPQITIQNELVPQAGMYDKYLAETAAGNPADVIMFGASEVPRFAKVSALAALDGLVTRDRLNVTQTFYEPEAKLGQWQGKQMGLPQTVAGGNYLLYYNRQHFQAAGLPDRAPATWTEVLQSAQKLTKREGDGYSQLGALFPLTNFQQMLTVNGGALFSADGRRAAFNGAEGLEALQWQLDAGEALYGGNAGVAATRTEIGQLGQRWPVRLSQRVNGVWAFFEFHTALPEASIGAGLFPSNRDKSPKSKATALADGQYCWLYSVPTGTKTVDAAWIWLRYLTEGEGNKKFFAALRQPSATRRWTEGPDYRRVNPNWQLEVEALKTATLVNPPPGYGRVQSTWSRMTNDVLNRSVGTREALEAAAREVQQILDEEWAR
jgi:multiple sugar transport system substrate-binding protein